MLNKQIIEEFEKLHAYLHENKDQENGIFRLRSIKTVLSILKKYPKKILLSNINELNDISGIGKGTIERIKEILTSGKLKEIENFVEQKSDLDQIIGIGPSKIKELHNHGIYTIKKLKEEIIHNKLQVSPTIKMGLKYHNVYKENIPRKEIDGIYKLLESILDKKYIFEICGSYRRKKEFSNDIDLLITTKIYNNNHLKLIIELLKEHLIVDSLVTNNKTKYMGFCKYKNNPVRRIDIRFVKYENFNSALLYFTGSVDLNKKMRNIAKKLGYKLSEYGLSKNNKYEKITSEKDIFDILGMDYLSPENR